jgi:peptidoglycan/LPS O-acetylase OafA/YrhL
MSKQAVLYVLIALALPAIFAGTQSSGLDRYLGELSYPIYLSHLVIIGAVRHLHLGVTETHWVTIAMTLAASVALYQWVQSPIDRFRAARAAHRPVAAEIVHGTVTAARQ